MPCKPLLYWHTVRHLRWVQLAARIRTKIPRPLPRANHDIRERSEGAGWVVPARRDASMLGPMTFRFLGEARKIDRPSWGEDASHLWRYNVHYFDDLNARDSSARHAWHEEAIQAWIEDHPPSGRGDAWAPYPTSLRIVNWIKWARGGGPLSPEAIASLATQAALLERRVEYHLLGNHLLANAKALVYAGVFLEGRDPDRWLRNGLRILETEVEEQILEDGGHFERSPMYHALVLEDLLDLINHVRATPGAMPAEAVRRLSSAWTTVAARMESWLVAMCHPDGEIAFFNDAAIGIAPVPAELFRYARELGIPGPGPDPADALHLSASGYVSVNDGHRALLVDVAPIGPDYLPGHAHADTLSFELSLWGQRVIVNGGTSRYGAGPERQSERGTASHSTVIVDGQDSSEVWSGFRVARRARPFDVHVDSHGSYFEIAAAHDGYRRLAGKPIHRRRWIGAQGRLAVIDSVEGRFQSAIARFHLHPDVRCEVDSSGRSGILRWPGSPPIRWHATGAGVLVEGSWYRPRFGASLPTCCIALQLAPSETARFEIAW
jgi:uncharacterized heparinase superfamily protein